MKKHLFRWMLVAPVLIDFTQRHADLLPKLIKRKSVPTERDIKITAVHEAGHALLHAALKCLPSHFVAVIEDDKHSFGYVTRVKEGHLHTSRTFAEWEMLVELGGLAAERKLLGEESLGSGGDYAGWLWIAEYYLANGFRGVYYRDAKTPEEICHNNSALNQLQRTHEAQLETFFELNVKVLGELSDALFERRRLDAQALAPFTKRVVLPDGFPRPTLASGHSVSPINLRNSA